MNGERSRNDEALAMLLSMGFDQSSSLQALNANNGNVEQAINCLLSGSLDRRMDTSSLGAWNREDVGCNNGAALGVGLDNQSYATNGRIIHCRASQYTIPSGSSACTFIALTMAQKFLQQVQSRKTIEGIVTESFLEESIQSGARTYSTTSSNSANGTAHSSVEEALMASQTLNSFSLLNLLPSSPRQGILDSSNGPMGLQSVLSGCQSDAASKWVAVVITKPPETILTILPPVSVRPHYILLDSHPRPNQLSPLNPSGSYALFLSSLPDLVKSLQQIFPATQLGPDVPEMVAMMYNCFDAYPFILQ